MTCLLGEFMTSTSAPFRCMTQACPLPLFFFLFLGEAGLYHDRKQPLMTDAVLLHVMRSKQRGPIQQTLCREQCIGTWTLPTGQR